MIITGTASGETLNGTIDADVIEALGGNDTVNAGGGNDTIYGGTGNDTLNGEDGDDLFIEDQATIPLDIFNGGAGTDTIELRVVPSPIITSLGPVSPHQFTGTGQLTSIERIVFASTSGQIVQGVFSLGLLPNTGITEMVGGAGRELATFVTGTLAGSYTIPTLTYTGFDLAPTNAWDIGFDSVIMSSQAATGQVVTLNANANVTALQILSGGAGDDTLNGSDRADVLIGGTGNNQLNGNGGNDLLQITNTSVPGPTGFGPPSTLTGAGSTFNGGTGTDVLGVGGLVQLQANLISIEGVLLLPAFTPPVPNTPKQDPTELVLDSAHIAMLPTDTFFTGFGTVWFAIDDGASFSANGYTFTPGSDVAFNIIAGDGNGLSFTGSSIGDRIGLGFGTQSASGGGGNDLIAFGSGTQTASGGAGADGFAVGLGSGRVTDFTQGQDYVDLTDSGITNAGRLMDLDAVQVGADTRISADSGGDHYEIVLANVALANLTVNDFRLATGGFIEIDYGTALADLLFGYELNDDLRGGDGNDRLYSGGGIDQLRGEGGDDVIVLDGGPTGFNVLIDGGTGTDTLVLRGYAPGSSVHQVIGNVTGLERLEFDSVAGESLTGVIVYPVVAGGLTSITGGAGKDTLAVVVTAAGTYQLNTLVLNGWDTAGQGDALALVAANGLTDGVTLYARSGLANQALIGALGNDELVGSGLADLLRGNAGDDALDGGAGADLMYGGTGDDGYKVDSQADLIFENLGEGHDAVLSTVSFYLYENVEDLNLSNGTGNTFGVGNELANVINGNDGSNLLLGGAGDDILAGHQGIDSLFGEDGADTLYGGAGIDYLAAGAGNDTLYGEDDADALYGEDGDDTLVGGSSFHTDILVAGAGNDILDGRSGQANPDYDEMDGGSGNDTYYVDTGADLTYEGIGGGTDTVHAEVTVPNAGVYLYANVENLVLLGTTAFGVGNELDNVMTGSASGNWLLGGLGNDTLNGKAGGDVLFGEGGADTFVFEAGTGGDVIGDFQAGTDKINLVGYGLDFAGAQSLFVQVGNVGAIQMTNGDVIVLHNVTMANLTAADFIFG